MTIDYTAGQTWFLAAMIASCASSAPAQAVDIKTVDPETFARSLAVKMTYWLAR